jgi:hypothetical protein
MTMQKLHFSITVNAPKKKVWDTMLQDATYRVWTSAFNPKGSWFEGDWNQGSTIRFLGPGENGEIAGMVSRIKENRPYEYVSIEHLGFIHDGQEDTTSDAVKKWTPAFENYAFHESNGVTDVRVDMDTDDDHEKMFEQMWPKALQTLKELAER